MTAALTFTDPRWDLPETVEAIAAGPDWQAKVEAFKALVDQRAHDLSHVAPIRGCPGCPQVDPCVWCGLPTPACEDPTGHYRLHRGSESSLLAGVGRYGCPEVARG